MISFDFQNLFQEILFWTHIFLIIAAVLVGLFVTPYLALILVACHRIHVYLLGECAVSKAQRRIGGLPGDLNFLQFAVKRIFQKELSHGESHLLDYLLAGSTVFISFIK